MNLLLSHVGPGRVVALNLVWRWLDMQWQRISSLPSMPTAATVRCARPFDLISRWATESRCSFPAFTRAALSKNGRAKNGSVSSSTRIKPKALTLALRFLRIGLLLLGIVSLLPGRVGAATLADFGYQNMKVSGAAALGARPLLVILLDLAGTGTFAHPNSYYQNIVFNPLNNTASGLRSVNGFMLVNSHGRFSLTPAGGGLLGPVNLPANLTAEALTNDVKKAGYALNAAALAGFDFAPFDSNQDGKVTSDELMVLIFDNVNQIDSGAARWANTDGISGAAFTPFGSSVAISMRVGLMTQRVSFATLCHELSHVLGTEDLYGLWNVTCHNYGYTLMSCTINSSSADSLDIFELDAWHKLQLGWVEPRIRLLTAGGGDSVAAAQTIDATNAPIILYDPAHGTSEFFLLEYRTSSSPSGTGYDDNLPSNGLGIWHVAQDANMKLMQITNVGQTVWLEGQPNLQRAEDNKELWTGGATTPVLRWLDGTTTGTSIKVEPFTTGAGSIAFDILSSATVNPTNTLFFSGASSAGSNAFTILGGTTTLVSAGLGQSSMLLRSEGGSIWFLDVATAATASFLVNGGPGNGGRPGTLQFHNGSTAAAATITNKAGALGANFSELSPPAVDGFGGTTIFYDTAKAGTAQITCEGEAFGNVSVSGTGGIADFRGSSSADHGTFIALGATAVYGNGGIIEFEGGATADHGTFANRNSNTGTPYSQGRTVFFENATAALGVFTNIGGDGGFLEAGGTTEFRGNSTAANGTFINQGGTGGTYPGRGATQFFENATAANGVFLNKPAPGGGGGTEFYGHSTAANGTFTNDSTVTAGGDGGGEILFKDDSTAGLAHFHTTGLAGGFVTFQHRSSADHGTFLVDPNQYNSRIVFRDTATAGDGTFEIGGSAYLQFFESATAGNAAILLRGNGSSASLGSFLGGSAGNATITVRGSEQDGNVGASLGFQSPATAGNAMITLLGASVKTYGASGGTARLDYGALAGTATFIANGGTNGGAGARIELARGATAEQARFILNAGSTLDVSGNIYSGGTTAGSIQGDGNVALGGSALAVGALNTSTTISGVISDGSNPPYYYAGGSLTKVGTGTLTLSGTNTFTGLTTINAGALAVNGALAGGVQVNGGATLKGSGTIAGTVTVGPGGLVGPGNSPGTLTIGGDYSQGPAGLLEIEVAGPNPENRDLLIVKGNANLGGTLLVVFSGYAPSATDTFPVMEVGGTFNTNNLNIVVLGLKPGFQLCYQVSGGKLILMATSSGQLRNSDDPIQVLKPSFALQSGFVCPVFTLAGANYQFDTSTDLKTWTRISELPGANVLFEFRNVPPAADPYRFYRVIQIFGTP